MLNRATVQGRLVADPELRRTTSDTAVCSFRVAWSEKYKETETKLFLTCTAWRGLGEMISKYFSKGKEIIVEGPLRTNTWADDEGKNRSIIEMTVDKVHFCGPKDAGDSQQPRGGGVDAGGPEYTDLDIDDVDLPF